MRNKKKKKGRKKVQLKNTIEGTQMNNYRNILDITLREKGNFQKFEKEQIGRQKKPSTHTIRPHKKENKSN